MYNGTRARAYLYQNDVKWACGYAIFIHALKLFMVIQHERC